MTNLEAIVAISVVAIPSVTSVVSILVSKRNGKAIQDLHILINNNLERQIASAVNEALMKGRVEGIEIEHNR